MQVSDFYPLLTGRILVLTGAGISVASGIPTFRGAADSLYKGLNPHDLASVEGFWRDPVRVWNWYLSRIRQVAGARPHEGHHALVDLEGISEAVTIVTSNVDNLHQRAGSKTAFRLHGDILQTKCTDCDRVDDIDADAMPNEVSGKSLPACQGCGGILRPNVVWFGEYPWEDAFEAVRQELPRAGMVLEVGTSGTVSYGFSQIAVTAGIPVLRVNPEPDEEPGVVCWPEKAEVALPLLVASARATR